MVSLTRIILHLGWVTTSSQGQGRRGGNRALAYRYGSGIEHILAYLDSGYALRRVDTPAVDFTLHNTAWGWALEYGKGSNRSSSDSKGYIKGE